MKNLVKIMLLLMLFNSFQSCSKEDSVETEEDLVSILSEGNKLVRQILGDNIGEMQFDNKEANAFRAYVNSSLLTAQSGNSNNGVNGSDFTDANAQIQFCANGTFVEALYSQVTVTGNGGSGETAAGTTYMPGYWEVAALPNGTMIIIMSSTHPLMLENFPNGIAPFVVAKHDVDFVQLPSGDLYRRAANSFCN